jgi:hypothetical protein
MRSAKTVILLVCVLAALGLVVGACSSGSSSSSKKTTSTTKKAKARPTITVTPATRLTDGQTVHVTALGFKPNEQGLGISECADKGDVTSRDDCDAPGIRALTSDAKGDMTVDYVVKKGPFGANNIVCSAQQMCLLSVSQLNQNTTEIATMDLSFAG